MTVAEILVETRINLGDVAGLLTSVAFEFSDAYLFEHIKSANNFLLSNSIITAEYTPGTLSFSPEPTTIDGMLLAAYAAYLVLKSDIGVRIRGGELGIRFKSGQDEISTVEAARKIETTGINAYRYFRNLVMAKLSGNTLNMERLQ